MIKQQLEKNKGITLITLIFAIIIMIIISSILIYNAKTGIKTRALNNMYKDIKILKDKVDIYYAKFGTLPIIKQQYTNVDNVKTININDNEKYYVIDLEALDNLTLTYGQDYTEYKLTPTSSLQDIYIINEQSKTIYYIQGIELDGIVYYTIPNEYTKIQISTRCNHPKLGTGMIPVKWNGTEFIETEEYDAGWYDYIDTSIEGQADTSKWANVKTEDGSMWVWIPRFAYKITYTDTNDKSVGGTIDVVFLKDDTNKDFRGLDVTNENYIDENGKEGAYIVHPSFQDGRGNNFANGEWNKEITGFWMAKFEAGYAGEANKPNTAIDSNVVITVNNQTSNYYGARAIGDKIKYPVFQASKPSMNYLGISDSYDLCRTLTADGNPYGFTGKVDSHLTKNSEWGAVAYLTHSKYGINGQEVRINNVSANGENTIYGVTGYGASTDDAPADTTRNLATLTAGNATGSWTTAQGQEASSTKNIYGIYDLNGGLWEWTAGYIAAGDNYTNYGGSLKGESNQYKSKYAGTSSINTTNYDKTTNKTRIGEAIWETSISGKGISSWNSDFSWFWCIGYQFTERGGFWQDVSGAGVFAFNGNDGGCFRGIGFRSVLICE